MLNVVNTLFRTYIGRYGRELQMHYDDPWELQREVLQHILQANRSTAFGREHDFYDLIKEPERFAERVPIRSYEEHLPYLQRILGGEKGCYPARRLSTFLPPAEPPVPSSISPFLTTPFVTST